MTDWREQRTEHIVRQLAQLKKIVTELNEKKIYQEGNISISNIQVPFSEVIKDALRGWIQLGKERLKELLDQMSLAWLISLDYNLSQAKQHYDTYVNTRNMQNFQQFVLALNNINTYLNQSTTHYAFLSQLYRDIEEGPKYVS